MRYASLRQGLVGCWCPSVSGPFGYRLPDLSGYGNHGTLTNMDPGTDWVASGGKGSLDFDGSNDRVVTAFSFANSPSRIAYSCWFRTPSPLSSFAMIMSQGTGLDQPELRFNSTTGKVMFVVKIGSNFVDQSDYSTSTTISSNAWYHAVGQFNGSTVQTWINGILDGSFAVTGAISLTANALNIASRNGSFNFSGLIDDIRIYNRALSESEIRLLASGRGVGLIPERQRNRYSAPAPTSRNRSSRFLSFPA